MLRNHMQKSHVSAELPFKCGCCDHRSSSLRHTIDHFYNDHTASGTLQCPFCLKIVVAVANNEQLTANIHGYYEHLKKHVTKTNNSICNRCSLRFNSFGALKVHQLCDHASQRAIQRHLRELCKNSIQIPRPKVSKPKRTQFHI